MAAPLVAYKAALLLRALPAASGNLIRALLALSAEVPSEARQCLNAAGRNAHRLILGYGMPNLQRALSSEERRVILVAGARRVPVAGRMAVRHAVHLCTVSDRLALRTQGMRRT